MVDIDEDHFYNFWTIILHYFFLRTNLTGQHIEWDFEIPKLYILGHYEVNGQILILPIVGSGKANVTISLYPIIKKCG